jgi:hypothetical protein
LKLKHPNASRPDDRSHPAVFLYAGLANDVWQRTAGAHMTWIKTVRMDEDERVKKAMEAQRAIYPIEYATPVQSVDREGEAAGITASHTLLPDALYHSFSTFGVLLNPDLPLTRDQHEMIATMVSVTNRCHY